MWTNSHAKFSMLVSGLSMAASELNWYACLEVPSINRESTEWWDSIKQWEGSFSVHSNPRENSEPCLSSFQQSHNLFPVVWYPLNICGTQLLGLMLYEWMRDLIYHLFVSCVCPYILQTFLFNYSGIGTWVALSQSSGPLADRIMQRSNS